MMDRSHITLNEFFSPQKESWRNGISTMESRETISRLKERLLKEARVKWPIAVDMIAEKITDTLNVSIPDVLVAAWSKYKSLIKYRDKEKYPPGETYFVSLAEHTIKSEHSPFLEILINEQPVGKIEFNISVSLVLEGIVLKIQDGKIKGLSTGTCKGKGTIKCENYVILEKETESFALPGSISLGEGIPITPG